MKTLLKYILLVAIVSSIVIFTNYKYPNHLKYIHNKVIDTLFITNTNTKINNNVTIVDIDNISIQKIGQWPWSRNIMAKLVEKLNKMSPSAIGFGIIFSEPDRTSPSNFQTDKKLENYDETFAMAIENSDVPVILGYNFLNNKATTENHIVPYVPAVFIDQTEKNKIGFFEPESSLLNIPIIQDSSYSSGFLNSITDENGRVIALPMIMQYKNQLLPSLTLEMLRSIYATREIKIKNNKDLGNFINIEDLNIPVSIDSSMIVDYSSNYKGIKHVSAVDILYDNYSKFNITDITNKIILIGSSASGLSLSTPTPFDTQISTIDLQALMLENLLDKNYLFKPNWEKEFNYMLTIVIAALVLLGIFYSSIVVNVSFAFMLAIITYLLVQHIFTEYGYIINTSYIIEAGLLSLIISLVIHFIKNKADLLNVKGKFASKVSKQVMDDLLNTKNKEGDLSSKKKNVTIFFSDIKGFTKITEKIDDPNKLTSYINRYMDVMTKNIMIDNEGTVDKFMGDAIMAYWNAPYTVENHSDKCLTSAVEQIELLSEINEINMEEKMPLIQIRIGITSGDVFVGEVGGELRSDYTIMGKNVNHAAVLEQAGKYYGANIIISQSVKDNLLKDYTMILLDTMQVDGTSDAFNIYQVFNKGVADKYTQDYIDNFESAINYYREADLDNAVLIFRNLLLDSNALNTKLCKIYIKRCEDGYEKIKSKKFSYIQSIDKSFISS
jgi:adenylate cyclase